MYKQKSLNIYIITIAIFIYLIAIPILFFHNSNYILGVIISSSILAIISIGVWLTFTIGRINIGQAAFVGIGGYTTAILLTKCGISFWICLPLSGIVAAFLSLLVGLLILRLKGTYFAMITLILTQTTNLIFLNTSFLTRGAKGIMNIKSPGALNIGKFTIIKAFGGGNYIAYYYLVAIILIFFIILIWRLDNCNIGLVLRSLRQSEALASSIGIDIVKYRILAYAICGFMGGIGGSLFIVYIHNIFPGTFKVTDSIYYMLYCFLGGLEYFLGPIFGAFFLTISFELLRGIQKYQELIYAIIMIVVMLWFPNGLLSLRFHKSED